MRLQRDVEAQLHEWCRQDPKKPLVVNGARQVGKTTLLKQFADYYDSYVYLNFERDPSLASYFQDSLAPDTLLTTLGLHSGVKIEPGRTLIIFDEAQECPRALNSLKYFQEEASEYHIIVAGSLLGLRTIHTEGFPVGKVRFLNMYPITFFEFLSALGQQQLREYLEHNEGCQPLPEPLHQQCLAYLKIYCFVGGMPEAVAAYLSDQSWQAIRDVQHDILQAYERDFAKHAPSTQIMKIMTVWEQVPEQLAKENKKFIFSAIRKSARGRDYEQAIEWLRQAGLVCANQHIAAAKLPLRSYAEKHKFKLFMLDVGLLAAKTRLAPRVLIEGHRLFEEFKGAITENFVAQELVAHGHQLYYWSQPGVAEIDFVIDKDQTVYPLEVKSGPTKQKRSLKTFAQKYPDSPLLRTSPLNGAQDGAIQHYPLYRIGSL